jgi:uncharacterized protein YndB with AHSA1/START domain
MSEPIVWRLRLRSSAEKVYEALATDAGRERFWVESSRETHGAIRFEFPDGQATTADVLEATRPRVFVLRYFGASTRFEIEPDGNGCALTLIATDVPPDEWNDVHAGWVSVLMNLKAGLDHGVDLRNHDASRSWAQRYVEN